MASNRSLPIAAVLIAALGVAAPARADQVPSASERETARSLMSEGRDRRAHNDLRGALESFKAADALMHVPTTGLEVARTQVALGQLVEARGTIRQVLRTPPRADEPKPFADARAAALTMDTDLATRIPSIHVVLENGPREPHVTIDGLAIPDEAASAPIKVDPGHHVVAAGEGAGAARAEVTVAERDDKSVTLTLPVVPTEPAADQASAATETPTVGPPSRPMRTVAIAGFVVAGTGLAAGSISGLMSIEKTSSIKVSCNGNHCPASSADDLSTAHTTATLSTVAFIVGGIGLGVGITALVIGDKPSDSNPNPPAVARVTPFIGLGSVGLRGSF